jgi:hypothetical protein
MSKLKIEHGASKVNWVLLKTNIDESIANEIDLMCQWSENDRKYIVNELLRFGLTQSEDFQKYKAERESNPSKRTTEAKPVASVVKGVADAAPKPAAPAATTSSRQQSTES